MRGFLLEWLQNASTLSASIVIFRLKARVPVGVSDGKLEIDQQHLPL
jgi:hypothetical protein